MGLANCPEYAVDRIGALLPYWQGAHEYFEGSARSGVTLSRQTEIAPAARTTRKIQCWPWRCDPDVSIAEAMSNEIDARADSDAVLA